MTSNPMMWWVIAAVFIIVVLAGYAIHLHLLLRQRNRLAASELEKLQSRKQQGNDYAHKSIVVIGRAMREGQCDIAEGCIRLSGLLSQLSPDNQYRADYRVFYQVAGSLEHIPILEKWQSLERKQQKAFTMEIKSIEAKYADFVEQALPGLINEYSASAAKSVA